MSTLLLTDFTLASRPGAIQRSCTVQYPGIPDPSNPDHLSCEVTGEADFDADPLNGNWAAVAMLYPAMSLGYDLHIEAKVSRKLLFNLRNDIQALLRAYDPRLKKVQVSAQVLDAHCSPSGRIATGFSAGIDSFATLVAYGHSAKPDDMKITDLAVFNVGAMGQSGAPSTEQFFSRAGAKSAEFSRSCGLGAFTVASNLDDFYRGLGHHGRFVRTHTLRNVSAALLLEGVVDTYLYSSGLPYAGVRVTGVNDMARFDPILLPLLCTERLGFISSGAGLTRGEKTRLIADSAEAQRYLDVCLGNAAKRAKTSSPNCGRCSKCQKAQLTLDALGKLESFAAVFDLPLYRANKNHSLKETWCRAVDGWVSDKETIQIAEQAGMVIPNKQWLRLYVLAKVAERKLRRRFKPAVF